jgi:hypothetical protein
MSNVRVSIIFDLSFDCDEDEALDRARESFENEFMDEDVLVDFETLN